MMRPRYLAPLVLLIALTVAVAPLKNLHLKVLNWLESDPGTVTVVMPLDRSYGEPNNPSCVKGEPHCHRSLERGAAMAAEIINNYPDKLGGKRLVLQPVHERPFDDGAALAPAVDASRELARRIIDRWSPLMVFGHDTSIGALTVASSYRRAGVLFLSPFATDPTLTKVDNDNVFSMVPNDRESANAVTRFLVGRNWRRIVLVTDLTAYGILSGRLFTETFRNRCGEIIHTETIAQDGLDGNSSDGLAGTTLDNRIDRLLMAFLNSKAFADKPVDAVVVYGLSDVSLALIKRARYLKLEMPFVGSDNITWIVPDTESIPAMRHVFGTATYNPESPDALRAMFRRIYREKYNVEADNEAAMGWDGIMLLNRAVKGAKSLDPDKLALELRAIRYTGSFAGMAGTYDFSPEGDPINKPLYVAEWADGGLKTVLAHQPSDPMPSFCDARAR